MPDGTVDIREEQQEEIAKLGRPGIATPLQSGLPGVAGPLQKLTPEQEESFWQAQQDPVYEKQPVPWYQQALEPFAPVLGPVGEFFERSGAGLWGGITQYGESRPFEETLAKYRTGDIPWYQKLGWELAGTAPAFAVAGGAAGAAPAAAAALPAWAARLAVPAVGGIGAASRGARAGMALPFKATAAIPKVGYRLAARKPLITPKPIGALIKREPLELISNDEIIARAYKPDWFRAAAGKAGKVPGLRSVMRTVFGPASVTGPDDVADVAMIVRGTAQENLTSSGAILTSELRSLGEIRQTLKGVSEHLYDVLDFPQRFRLNAAQKKIVNAYRAANEKIDAMLAREGLRPAAYEAGGTRFHRMVSGIQVEGELIPRPRGGLRGRAGQIERKHVTQADGVAKGVVYEPDPLKAFGERLNAATTLVSNERMQQVLKIAWRTPKEKMPYNVLMEASIANTAKRHAKVAVDSVNRAFTGDRIAPSRLAMIEREFPETGGLIRRALRLDESAAGPLPSAEAGGLLQQAEALAKAKLAEVTQTVKVTRAAKAKAAKAARTPGWRTLTAEEARAMGLKPVAQTVPEAIVPRLSPGRIFVEPVAERLQAQMADQAGSWLRRMAAISAAGRMAVAALDLSAPFIQGLPILGRNPVIWAKGVKKQLGFFAHPQNLQKYIAENRVILEEMRVAGSVIQPFEFFEILAPAMRKFPKAATALEQTYGRAEAAFTGYSTVARVEMWKALSPGVAQKYGAEGLVDLARTLDRMVGIMSTRSLGLPAGQRAFETAVVFFSPRYTRAGFALIGDLAKSGVSGNEARRALAQLAAGGAAMYYGACKALGQEPSFNPTNAQFMTVEIGGRHIGIGGFMYGLLRLAGNTSAAISDVAEGEKSWWDIIKPIDEGGLNRWDNPFIRFMYSRSAPLTGIIRELTEQENYFGEPFETPEDWGRFIGSKVLPIWVQSAVVEEEGLHPAVVAGEISGLRTFPLSEWEQVDALRDKYAQEMFNKPWNQLEIDERDKVERVHLDIGELERKAGESWVKRGAAESKQWLTWEDDRKAIRENNYLVPIRQTAEKLEKGIISGSEFRDEVSVAGRSYGDALQDLERRYPEIYQDLATGEPDPDKRFDLALFDYYEIMANPELEAGEEFNYSLWRQLEADWQAKWPDMVERVKEYRWRDDPPALLELRKAREVLRPYWEIRDKIIQAEGLKQKDDYARQLENMGRRDEAKAFRDMFGITQVEKFVEQYRQRLRETDPLVWKYYNKFYRR